MPLTVVGLLFDCVDGHGLIRRWDGLAAFRCIDVFMDDAFTPVVEGDSERAINGSFTFVGRKHVQDITEHVGNLISIHWSIRGKETSHRGNRTPLAAKVFRGHNLQLVPLRATCRSISRSAN